MIYLDYTSTTPVREEVLESFVQTTKNFWGNPSSLHKFGLISEDLLKMARKQMKDLIDAKNYEVVFTSCATESNNLAIKGIAHRKGNNGKHLITSGVEHPSVYHTFESLREEGYDVTFLKVNKDGRIDLEELKNAIRKDTILVSLMFVNNEIGTIMPIIEVGKLLKKFPKITFHVDIVQALGKIPVKLDEMNIDLATISAHKIYGLKGSGALFVRKGIEIVSQQTGGSQEFNLRAGTVDVPSAVSLAKAMRLILNDLDKSYEYVTKLNNKVRTMLINYPEIIINSPVEQVSPYIINFSVKGVKSETFVHAFEPYEIYFSSKSACSSKISKPSRILKAIGLDDDLASNSVRISLSHLTTDIEIDELEKAFKEVINNLR
ncbi:MAG: cysteine desulfurase [Haloplasmataceae bacterium]|nr:cysteine desulfurase [Haloplasmataceae bacterium]